MEPIYCACVCVKRNCVRKKHFDFIIRRLSLFHRFVCTPVCQFRLAYCPLPLFSLSLSLPLSPPHPVLHSVLYFSLFRFLSLTISQLQFALHYFALAAPAPLFRFLSAAASSHTCCSNKIIANDEIWITCVWRLCVCRYAMIREQSTRYRVSYEISGVD